MKFDRRSKRRAAICGVTRKRMFKSPKSAIQFVAELGADCKAPVMRAYPCLFCGEYHLTSQEYDRSRRYTDFQRDQQQHVATRTAKSSLPVWMPLRLRHTESAAGTVAAQIEAMAR